MAVVGIDINHPASEQCEDKEASISANTKTDGNHLDHVASTAEKGHAIGAGNSKKFESLSSKKQEHGTNLPNANSLYRESSKGSFPANIVGLETKPNVVSGANEILTSFPTMFRSATALEMCASGPRSAGGKVCERVDTVGGNKCWEVDHHQIHSHTLDKQYMQATHSSGSDGNSHYQVSRWNQLAEVDCNIAEETSRHFRVPEDNLQSPILIDRTNIGKDSRGRKNSIINKKSKERISYTGGSHSKSKERNDSYESVESNNSKYSKGKRTLCIDLDNSESSKRLKKLGDESSCTSLLMGQGSSFLNWITNVAKGFSDSVPKHSHVSHYANSFKPFPQAKNKDLEDSSVGFRSFVQTLYRPGLKSLPWTISETHCSQEDFGEVKQLQVSSMPPNNIVHDKDEFKPEQPVPLSCRRPDKCQFGETPPATVPRTSSSSSPFHGRHHLVANEHPDMCIWGSSSSSIQNSSVPAPNGSLSPHISSGGSEYLGSLWIARLCRKPAAKAHEQDNRDVSSTAERQVEDSDGHIHQPHIDNSTPNENNQRENNGYSSSDDQVNTLTNELHLPSTSDNCFPKGICRVQKLKSKLNPILPSQRLKKLEPMATIFAKRLDALRNIKSSRLVDDLSTSNNSTCLFCGRSGHFLDECSEINDYERDDLLKNIISFERLQKTSFCIRCFQINHWAVACPYESGKQKGTAFHDASQRNSLDADCKQLPEHTACFTGFDVAASSKKCEDQNRPVNMDNIYCGKTSDFGAENSFPKTGRFEAQGINEITINESKVRGKQIASCLKNVELEGNQNLAMYNSFKRARIFEIVRGLRISRSDLMRMNSTVVGSGLEGFYLRVRCGKCLDSCGRNDYHVACIHGISFDKSQGRSRCHISVDIEGVKCFVDCQVVSNQDFAEDELNAWWSQAQRDGCGLPTEEALTKKLLERRRLDF